MLKLSKNVIKVANWYTVKEGDATMILIASLPGPKIVFTFLSLAQYKDLILEAK